jgi:hypothetical protein
MAFKKGFWVWFVLGMTILFVACLGAFYLGLEWAGFHAFDGWSMP